MKFTDMTDFSWCPFSLALGLISPESDSYQANFSPTCTFQLIIIGDSIRGQMSLGDYDSITKTNANIQYVCRDSNGDKVNGNSIWLYVVVFNFQFCCCCYYCHHICFVVVRGVWV